MDAFRVRKGPFGLRCVIDILCSTTLLVLVGCGFGAQSALSPAGPSSYPGVAFSGIIHGGPNPVVGATVKLYATGSSSPGSSLDGYGVGTFLAEAVQQGSSAGQDTNAAGGFQFTYGSYTCPAKQFAYIVASGGNPGGGINSASVLVAAIGRCEDLTASTSVYINELTTIAAAYALGHFTSITCGGVACTSSNLSASSIAVGIGAPVTANSQMYTSGGYSAGCISNSFYTTAACPTTSTAALYHAFLNAANLMTVTSFQLNANTAIVSPGTTVNPPVVNNYLLNAMGNALVACVNSTGASSTACSYIFSATTIGGVTPTNTLQAMINLAQNPTLAGTTCSGSPCTVANFLNVATPATNSYSPFLASTNGNFRDFELTIYYPAGLGANSAAPFQGMVDYYNVGEDINDTLYVGNQSATTSTKGNLVSFSSNGTLLSYTPDNTTNGESLGIPSPDGFGKLYTCSSYSSYSVAQWSVTAAGAITGTPVNTVGLGGSCEGLAVDQSGNVWASSNNGTTTATYNLFELTTPFGAGSSSTSCTSTVNCTGVLDVNNLSGISSGSTPQGIAVDPNQNIWFADQVIGGSSAGEVSVLQNTGSVTSPAYTFQSCITGSGSGAATSASPCMAQQKAGVTSIAAGGELSYDLVFVPSGSSYVAWLDNDFTSTTYSGVSEITPSFASSPSTEISSVAKTTFLTTATSAQNSGVELLSMASDGAGNVFSDNLLGNQLMETTAAGANIGLFPCVLKSGGTGCTSTAPSAPRGITVDSTGSVWLSAGTSGMLQIIGLAAPTWPQLSLGKVGKP